MNQMHIYEIKQVIIELERYLQASFVSKNISNASGFITALFIVKVLNMICLNKSHQKHLPHLNRCDSDEFVLAQVIS